MNILGALIGLSKTKKGFTLLLSWTVPLVVSFVLPLIIKNQTVNMIIIMILAFYSLQNAQKFGISVIAYRDAFNRQNKQKS